MGQSQNLEPAQKQSKQALIEHLFVLGVLVLHDCIRKEGQTLPEQLASIALKVFRLLSCSLGTVGSGR